MPLAFMFILLYSIYSARPIGVVESMITSCQILFLTMVWLGITACEVETPVSEQILVLRTKSAEKYYLSQILFMFSMGAVLSAASLAVPLWKEIFYAGGFFSRPLNGWDMFCGFILFVLSAACGSALGGFTHSRIMRSRKNAVITVFLLTILTMLKVVALERFPFSEVILWVLPPMSELSVIFSGKDSFRITELAWASGLLGVSAAALCGIRCVILLKRRF